MQQMATLENDKISKINVANVGAVTVATTLLPRGVYSAWSPTDRILILDQSLSDQGRAVALSRWSAATSRPGALSTLTRISRTNADR